MPTHYASPELAALIRSLREVGHALVSDSQPLPVVSVTFHRVDDVTRNANMWQTVDSLGSNLFTDGAYTLPDEPKSEDRSLPGPVDQVSPSREPRVQRVVRPVSTGLESSPDESKGDKR